MICPACEHNNLPGSEYCRNCYSDLTHVERPVVYDRVERSLLEDTVSVLAPPEAICLPPDATVGYAIRVLLDRNIGALPIVDKTGNLLGIFSERDLLTRVAGDRDDYAVRPVSEYMTPTPETVRDTDPLALVLHKMHVGGYRHLLVLRQGKVLGMISVRDMLRHVTDLCRQANC